MMPFCPKPPPTSTASTCTSSVGRPSESAMWSRSRCGVWLLDQTVIRPSYAPGAAWMARVSIGEGT